MQNYCTLTRPGTFLPKEDEKNVNTVHFVTSKFLMQHFNFTAQIVCCLAKTLAVLLIVLERLPSETFFQPTPGICTQYNKKTNRLSNKFLNSRANPKINSGLLFSLVVRITASNNNYSHKLLTHQDYTGLASSFLMTSSTCFTTRQRQPSISRCAFRCKSLKLQNNLLFLISEDISQVI